MIRGKKQITCSTGEVVTTYNGYLSTNHWKAMRLVVAEEYNYTCIRCYNIIKKGFHIHHNSYKRLGKEELKDLSFYCHRFHTMLHKKRKDKRAWNSQYNGLISSKMCKFDEEEIEEVIQFIDKIVSRKAKKQ